MEPRNFQGAKVSHYLQAWSKHENSIKYKDEPGIRLALKNSPDSIYVVPYNCGPTCHDQFENKGIKNLFKKPIGNKTKS